MTKKLTIEQLLGKAYDNYCFDQTAQDRMDFVFHMTDWKSDLGKLFRLYNDPGSMSRKEAHDAVSGFLLHAPWHLNAAYRLLWGYEVPNPFGPSEASQTEKSGSKKVRTKKRMSRVTGTRPRTKRKHESDR
jgi:hypothetical protein